MEHKEYIRISENADIAVLFIHGILGTPNHFDIFLPLVPQTYSVYNLLLDGHGKKVSDFAKTSMKKWEQQVASAVEMLSATHDEVYIAAHSMGTLLAIEQAINNEKISRLFLLAVPLKLFVKPKVTINAMKVYFNRIAPEDAQALAAKYSYSIEDDKNIFRYIGWIPRYLELFTKIRKTRGLIERLNTKCWAYQSGQDEMVSRRSIGCLRKNARITVNELKDSGHFYYTREDVAYLTGEFVKALN